jgi:hypothetical protein
MGGKDGLVSITEALQAIGFFKTDGDTNDLLMKRQWVL